MSGPVPRGSAYFAMPALLPRSLSKRPRFESYAVVIPGRGPKGREPGIHMWTAPGPQEAQQRADRIACDHMSGLLSRSHMTAAKMGFAT